MKCLVVVQAVGHLLLHMKSMAMLFSQSEERDLLAILRQASGDWTSQISSSSFSETSLKCSYGSSKGSSVKMSWLWLELHRDRLGVTDGVQKDDCFLQEVSPFSLFSGCSLLSEYFFHNLGSKGSHVAMHLVLFVMSVLNSASIEKKQS